MNDRAVDAHEKRRIFSLEKLKFYLHASLLGIYRGGMSLILEHPLESIKTQWQAKPHLTSTKEVIKYIYTKKGYLGFYRGFMPNLIRIASKQFYRWPMMIFFPRLFEKHLPKSYMATFPGLAKILAGLVIANVELIVICPLERLKVFFMTSAAKVDTHFFVYFYQEHKNSLLREIYRGFEASFWRSNVSWVTFLYLDSKFKREFKKFRKNEILNFSDLILISIFVGMGNLLAGNI